MLKLYDAPAVWILSIVLIFYALARCNTFHYFVNQNKDVEKGGDHYVTNLNRRLKDYTGELRYGLSIIAVGSTTTAKAISNSLSIYPDLIVLII